MEEHDILEWAQTVEIQFDPLPDRTNLLGEVQEDWMQRSMQAQRDLRLPPVSWPELRAQAPSQITLVDIVDYVRDRYSYFTDLIEALEFQVAETRISPGGELHNSGWEILFQRTNEAICDKVNRSYAEYERMRIAQEAEMEAFLKTVNDEAQPGPIDD